MHAIRFFLAHGGFFDAAVGEPEAREIIERWESGFYKLHNARCIHGSFDGRQWSVLVDAIQAIHTFYVTQAQPTTMPGQQGYPGQGQMISGIMRR